MSDTEAAVKIVEALVGGAVSLGFLVFFYFIVRSER